MPKSGEISLARFALACCLAIYGCASLPATTKTATPVDTNPRQSTTPPVIVTASPEPTLTVLKPCTPDYCIRSGSFPLSRPILPPANDRVDDSYRYGYTQSGARDAHHGVEFTNPVGTPVLAAADGVVIYAGDDTAQVFGLYPGFYGNLVLLEHQIPGLQSPVFTLYGHLSSIAVQTGDRVSRGEVIGAVGLTGSAIGSHLHFETRFAKLEYGNTVNPELFLPPLPLAGNGQPTGVLVGRIEDQFGGSLRIPLTIQPQAQDGSLGAAIYPEIYGSGVPTTLELGENFLVSGLPAGIYRLAFINYSKVFERTVEVIPGWMTFVKIRATP